MSPCSGRRRRPAMTPQSRRNACFQSSAKGSTLICTPASRSQEVGACLGAQAGESKLRDVVSQGGFSRFRRATETPFNLVLEARP